MRRWLVHADMPPPSARPNMFFVRHTQVTPKLISELSCPICRFSVLEIPCNVNSFARVLISAAEPCKSRHQHLDPRNSCIYSIACLSVATKSKHGEWLSKSSICDVDIETYYGKRSCLAWMLPAPDLDLAPAWFFDSTRQAFLVGRIDGSHDTMRKGKHNMIMV